MYEADLRHSSCAVEPELSAGGHDVMVIWSLDLYQQGQFILRRSIHETWYCSVYLAHSATSSAKNSSQCTGSVWINRRMNFSKTNSTYSSYANDDFFNLNISQKTWCNILNSMRCKVGLTTVGILVEKAIMKKWMSLKGRINSLTSSATNDTAGKSR